MKKHVYKPKRAKTALTLVPIDEWGDEGVWKTLIDFTEIRPGGVPVKDILMLIEYLDFQDKQPSIS